MLVIGNIALPKHIKIYNNYYKVFIYVSYNTVSSKCRNNILLCIINIYVRVNSVVVDSEENVCSALT